MVPVQCRELHNDIHLSPAPPTSMNRAVKGGVERMSMPRPFTYEAPMAQFYNRHFEVHFVLVQGNEHAAVIN